MLQRIGQIVEPLWGVDKKERLKLFLLSFAYFLIIAAYTAAKELKDSVFVGVVGKDYIPSAKILAMFVLIPAIFFYSKMVDKMRRYQLLMVLSLLYSVVGLVFAFFLGHPTIGLANTNTSWDRLFGWLFFFFMESYTPFLVSVFWAFANSINDPKSARKGYGFMVAASKLGGIVSAGFGWYIFSRCSMDLPESGYLSVVGTHQLMVALGSVFLLIIPVVVYTLMRKVPGHQLHGYEAVYQHEKAKKKAGKAETGIWAGIKMFLRYPYLSGIFGMIFFYEVMVTILSFLRVGVATATYSDLAGVSAYFFKLIFIMHVSGFVISLLGTGALLRLLGERICLILVPVVSGILVIYLVSSGSAAAGVGAAYVMLKSINYAFGVPVRESLYIPTVKEIKFKSKSWIDAFGSKFSKSVGSVFNGFAARFGVGFMPLIHTPFFVLIIGAWVVTAWLLGRRFEQVVENNEVIGADLEE